jgi:antitoxin component of MazEF toxin-antitoxin module
MDIDIGTKRIRWVRKSAVITLPRVWVGSVGLSKGDAVNIKMLDDGRLIIVPQKGTKIKLF